MADPGARRPRVQEDCEPKEGPSLDPEDSGPERAASQKSGNGGG